MLIFDFIYLITRTLTPFGQHLAKLTCT